MNEEDLLPRPQAPRKLEDMSIEDLEEVIAACEARIVDAQTVMAAKRKALDQASSIFKKK